MNFSDIERAQILDKLPFMAFQYLLKSPNFPFIFASGGSMALTGYDAGAYINSEVGFLDILHQEDIQLFLDHQEATLAFGEPLEVVLRIIAKDGTEKRVLSRSYIAKTDDVGMPYIIEGSFTDITKQIKKEAASVSNRAGTVFWSKMGFEVRTPMNAILGLAELGLREDLPHIVREYTLSIKKSGRNLMSVLNNIMDYQLMENDALQIHAEEYATASLVNDVITDVQEQIGTLNFHVFVDSRLPAVLVGDIIRLRQVMLNLLNNSIKFTDRGHISLSVKGENKNGMCNLVITIEDTGRGIKTEDNDQLFVPFAQFDDKTYSGTGLGLPVTHRLVKLMGGDIQFVSNHGLGCIFTVTLPQGVPPNTLPLCEITNPEEKNVLILTSKQHIYSGTIAQTFLNLNVSFRAVSTIAEFSEIIKTERFSHIFADNIHGEYLHDAFKHAHPDLYDRIKILLITNQTAATEGSIASPLFCLPVATVLYDTPQQKSNSQGMVRFTAPDIRVLIVDDMSANVTVVTGFLRGYDVQISSCVNGAQAVEAAKLKPYDIIFMDHLMPVMTGVEATEEIRETTDGKTDCANVPIIAMTANTDNTSRELFQKSGFSDFLPKPIDEVVLNALLEKWIPNDKKHPKKNVVENAQATLVAPPFTIAGVDVQKGIASLGGNTDTYLQFLKQYALNVREIISRLQSSAAQGNMTDYKISIHALKGISAGVGAAKTVEIVEAAERACDQADVPSVQAQTSNLVAHLEALIEAIRPVLVKAAAPKPPVAPPASADSATGKKKILIIDDTDIYISLLDDILMPKYTTLAALNGEAGLKTARRVVPDFILLDIYMPGVSGYTLLETLKADETTKHIPVVMMSAQEEEYNQGEALGAVGFVKKPFEPAKVKNLIETILRRQEE